MRLRSAQAQLERPYLKNKIKIKKAEGISQVVEHLPNKSEVLGLIPCAAKIQNEAKQKKKTTA
jgi:hypothetical protein